MPGIRDPEPPPLTPRLCSLSGRVGISARGWARPSAGPPFTKEVQGKQGKPFGSASG